MLTGLWHLAVGDGGDVPACIVKTVMSLWDFALDFIVGRLFAKSWTRHSFDRPMCHSARIAQQRSTIAVQCCRVLLENWLVLVTSHIWSLSLSGPSLFQQLIQALLILFHALLMQIRKPIPFIDPRIQLSVVFGLGPVCGQNPIVEDNVSLREDPRFAIIPLPAA